MTDPTCSQGFRLDTPVSRWGFPRGVHCTAAVTKGAQDNPYLLAGQAKGREMALQAPQQARGGRPRLAVAVTQGRPLSEDKAAFQAVPSPLLPSSTHLHNSHRAPAKSSHARQAA